MEHEQSRKQYQPVTLTEVVAECHTQVKLGHGGSGLLPVIKEWIASGNTYTIRYGIGTLMSFYLDEDFKPEYIEIVASVQSEEYYVNMMIAWYLATALAKQWDATIPYLEERKLSPWVHRKTIQKAVESYRITDEQKVYLKTLRENC